jgi:glycosyltransferase involved in cell wall biosynthesis
MASGLAVVATDSGGVREFVDEPIGGAIVPTGDAPALADALERFLSDRDRRLAAAAHNRTKAATQFSWRASTGQLLDVYRAAIDSRRGGAAAAA